MDHFLATDAQPTATDIRHALDAGQAQALTTLTTCIERIQSVEPSIHAWTETDFEGARAAAAAVDAHPGAMKRSPLAGIPLGVKDLFDVAGMRASYGSPLYADHRPAKDAELVRQLRDAGAVIVGKTVTTEFGYFAPGPTANPHDVRHTPGGSSSGSAAAVASGMVPIAFGTQTAGSLIRPASYCGVFALKPTFGVHPLGGVKGMSHAMDTVGWMARSADDLELVRAALAGEEHAPLAATPGRLAWCKTFEWNHVEPAAAEVFLAGIDVLRQRLGQPIPEVQLPESMSALVTAQRTIMAREASRSLAAERRDHRAILSQPLLDLLDAGDQVSDAAYEEALALAEAGRGSLATLLASFDALITPAAPGEAPAGLAATGSPEMNRVWNLLGGPVVNVPGLVGAQGLPLGLQLVGRRGEDRHALMVAKALHEALRA